MLETFAILILAWILWVLLLRELYFSLKYKNPNPIPITDDMTTEYVYILLSEKLKYPTQKSLTYDENGAILLICKYGRHIIEIENKSLFVTRDSSHHSKNIEEAECIDAYIRKILNPNEPTDPYAKYEKMNSHKKQYILVYCMLAISLIGGSIAGFWYGGYNDIYMSNNISRSYLTHYSTSTTIGDAFDNFFIDGEWSKFSDGSVEYVDYNGKCLYNNDEANACIRFWSSDDNFRIEKILINGMEISDIVETIILNMIYNSKTTNAVAENGDFEASSISTDSFLIEKITTEFLQGSKEFVDFETNKKASIHNLTEINNSYIGSPRLYATTDLDADGIEEILIQYDAMGDTAIIHKIGNTYFSYYVPFQGIKDIKFDGTISWSDGAYESGVHRLTFSEYGMVSVDTILHNTREDIYIVDNIRVSEYDCSQALKLHEEKSNIEWYPIAPSNSMSPSSTIASAELNEMKEYFSQSRLFYNVEKRFGELTYETTIEGGDYYYTSDDLCFVFVDGNPECVMFGMKIPRAYPGIENYADSNGFVSKESVEAYFGKNSIYTESEMFYGGWLEIVDSDICFEANEHKEIHVEQYVFF